MLQSLNEALRRWALLLSPVVVMCICLQGSGQSSGVSGQEQIPAPGDPNLIRQGEPSDQQSSEVAALEEGPIHEAFAEPIVANFHDDIIVDREPPEPIEEVPPEYRPSGDNVEWIPGYWFWLSDKNDFIWVSGVWRAIPPGRVWTPGYWVRDPKGYRWVRGFWSNVEAEQVEYLPYPPESLEQGPSSPSPRDNYFWVPGCWQWQGDGYVWRPGYWYPGQSNWVWVPNRYVYTPSGAVFINGYWDYPLQQRGLLYSPVYWSGGYRGGYRYTPSRLINTALLLSSLFIDSNRGYYYYGAGYGQQNGYYPWYTGYGNNYYSPMYGYYAAQFGQDSAIWRDRFDGRRRGPGNRDRRDNVDGRGNLDGRGDTRIGLIGTLEDVRRAMQQDEDPRSRQAAQSILQLTDADRDAARERVRNLRQFESARAKFEAAGGNRQAQARLERRQSDDGNQPQDGKVRVADDFKPRTMDLRTADGAQQLRQRARQRYEVMRPNFDQQRDDAARRDAARQEAASREAERRQRLEERRQDRAGQENRRAERGQGRELNQPESRGNRRPPAAPGPRTPAVRDDSRQPGNVRRQREAGPPERGEGRSRRNAERREKDKPKNE